MFFDTSPDPEIMRIAFSADSEEVLLETCFTNYCDTMAFRESLMQFANVMVNQITRSDCDKIPLWNWATDSHLT